jgi:amidase
MQRLTRDNVFRNYGGLDGLPARPPLSVHLGERFIVETLSATGHVIDKFETPDEVEGIMAGNPSTGPIEIIGIKKDDVIACHIYTIEPVGHTVVGTGGVLEEEFEREDCFLVRLENGVAIFPGGIDLPLRPMIGCFGVAPEIIPAPEPWMHGGNMDITEISPGSCVHVKAQRDGAWLAVGDVHAHQGEAEINGAALEMAADVVLSVERSRFASITWPVVETDDRIIAVGINDNWTVAVKNAVRDMSNLLSRTNQISFAEAYMVVSHCADVRSGAVWMMRDDVKQVNPVTVTVCLERELFHSD